MARRFVAVFLATAALLTLTDMHVDARRRRQYPTGFRRIFDGEPLETTFQGNDTIIGFRGRVGSPKRKCYVGRLITATYQGDHGFVDFGEATTDENGDFFISGEGPIGPTYFITADEVQFKRFSCNHHTLVGSPSP